MRRIPSVARRFERRICQLQHTVRLDTTEMRNKWIRELDDLFDTATSIAKGKISQQQVGDKLQTITPKERQMWTQLAANICMVMGNLTKACDERQIDEDLDELEKAIRELNATHEKEATANSTTTPNNESSEKSP